MIEFNWELLQILSGVHAGLNEKQANLLLRPHDAIWGDVHDDFCNLADSIMELFPSEQIQRQFLAVCFASYLLSPQKAPDAVPVWVQKKIAISELIGCDVPLETMRLCRWDRAAFPVLDKYEDGKNDTIYYAVVASSKVAPLPLFPSWIDEVMNTDAQEAVSLAVKFARKLHPEHHFFFWPFINPKKPTHDCSLGLPIYLSLLSLAKCKPIPMYVATGEIDKVGTLRPVDGIVDKCDKAFEKGFKRFIYPDDGSCLERRKVQRAVSVTTLFEAECQWGVRKKAKDNASLKRYIQTICSAVLGSENLECIIIDVSDTKSDEVLPEDFPSTVTATHEYIITVDMVKVRSLTPNVRQAFESFLGKKIYQHKTETTNKLYWGEGEPLTL